MSICDIKQITNDRAYRELQVNIATHDYLAVKQKAEALLLSANFSDISFETMDAEPLDLNSELLKNFIMKSWVDAKKNLSEWRDIQDVCGDSRRL